MDKKHVETTFDNNSKQSYNSLGMPSVTEWRESYKNKHGHYPITVDEKLLEKLQKEENWNIPSLLPGKPAKSRVTISSETYKKMKKKTLGKR